MRKLISLLLVLVMIPCAALADNVLTELMQKFGYGWEYGEYALSDSPYKLVLPDGIWPIPARSNMIFSAQTEVFDKTQGKLIEGVWGYGATAEQLIQTQMNGYISSNKAKGYKTYLLSENENAYQLWLEKIQKKSVVTYIETTQVMIGDQPVSVRVAMENYNRRDAINSMGVYTFEFNDGNSACIVCYSLIESVDPALSAEAYAATAGHVRQQLLDFAGTVLVAK